MAVDVRYTLTPGRENEYVGPRPVHPLAAVGVNVPGVTDVDPRPSQSSATAVAEPPAAVATVADPTGAAAGATDNWASLGLQQDADGYFKPIPGFGVAGGGHTQAELAAMSDDELTGLMLSSSFDAQTKANQANVASLAEQLNLSSGFGETARQEIADVFTQERGRSTQSLAARGLGSTTANDAAQAGIAGREARAVTRLEESVAAQKIAILGGSSFQQPDSSQLYGQMLQAGQAGVGSSPPSTPAWWEGPALGVAGSLATEVGKQWIGGLFKKGGEPTVDVFSGFDANAGTASLQDIRAGGSGGGGGTGYANVRGQSPDLGGVGSGTVGVAKVAGSGGTAGYATVKGGTAGYATVKGGSTAGYATVKGGAAAGGAKAAMLKGLMATAPWVAAGIAAYFIYKNNKEKVDNLYDDAEEYVKDVYDDTEERVKKGVKKTGKKIKRETNRVVNQAKRRARKWGIKL